MIPEYAQLNEDTRRVVRRRPRIGTGSGVWWCPFCDHSQADGRMDCARCGATAVAKPAPVVTETVQQPAPPLAPPLAPSKPKSKTRPLRRGKR